MIYDVIRSPDRGLRYRVRLAGTQIVELQGYDPTGKFVDEVLTTGPELISSYDEIVADRQPRYRRGEVAAAGREHRIYERIVFPLAADGDNVDMLIFVFAIDSPSRDGKPHHLG